MSKLAYDRVGSVRTFDGDGRLKVELTPITKAQISGYRGREIPRNTELGLQPEKMYYLLRDPEELKAAVDSFNGIPLLDEHEPTSADHHPRDKTVGTTRENAIWDNPFIKVGLIVNDGKAIDAIKSGEQRELSCGYHYTADMTPGTYEGQKYDGVMRNIRGNHVALVPRGRVGPEAYVADISPINQTSKEKSMAQDNNNNNDSSLMDIVYALQKEFCGDCSQDAIRAGLSDLIARLNNATDNNPEQAQDTQTLKENEMSEKDNKKTAQDDENEEKKHANEVIGGEKANKTLEQEAEDDENRPKEKQAEDGALITKDQLNNAITMAVDAALKKERSNNKALNEAREIVRPLVGSVMGLDSAVEVYKYALTQTGMAQDSLEDINEAGLKSLVSSQLNHPKQPPASLAQDSATESDIMSAFGVSFLPKTL